MYKNKSSILSIFLALFMMLMMGCESISDSELADTSKIESSELTSDNATNSNAISTITLSPDVDGDATISESGHYVSSDDFRTVTISSDNVTLDGLTFEGDASVAVKNGVSGLSNITIKNSTFSGYSGRMITFGFAEGARNADDRAANIAIIDNYLGGMTGDDATAIAVFDTDGVTVENNVIDRSEETNSGRRGVNLDGNTDVLVKENTIDLGATGKPVQTFSAAPWIIQVSMSNAPTSNVDIIGNTLSGAYIGVSTLSQRDVTDLRITNNEINALIGIITNTGGVPPENPTLTLTNIDVHGNIIDGSSYPTSYGIYLRNLHNEDYNVIYKDVKVNGNRIRSATVPIVVLEEGITLENVKIQGNPAFTDETGPAIPNL